MTEDQVLFISQTLLASAFYYGIAGGLVGSAIVPVVRFVWRKLYSAATQWR